ncbi:tRNA lysidine(34) synthetase TilS [Qipengyuania sp. G39]|uniref:tRNA(Ile)-lysidine synthase n=1 Tax=Qipengyuania profundimaris TaxID=3067652 RepID=A0ABT9HMI4_9SPHN|nr:tRNA lysidine(34) synthetase TilS [Qipengyuania sp. G39]MDP4574360.1 tRNA lysidine(34) synthetase TilS [Qipengyuania sp. G39]
MAVSGGSDSMAMLLLAHAAGLQCLVATVNHGLRAEAASECLLVEELCGELGVPCTVIDIMLAKGNVQQEARRARYEALAKWAMRERLELILTAHHADDQAETLLMRLNRGSGLAGLAGVRERRLIEGTDIELARPLLGFRRNELWAVIDGTGIAVADDPSNRDTAYDRVRVRQHLERSDWIDVDGLARSASLIEESWSMVEGLAAEDVTLHTKRHGEAFAYDPFAASGVARVPVWIEVVRMIAGDLGVTLVRGDAAKIVAALQDARKVNVGGLSAEVIEDQGAKIWSFRREPPRRTG